MNQNKESNLNFNIYKIKTEDEIKNIKIEQQKFKNNPTNHIQNNINSKFKILSNVDEIELMSEEDDLSKMYKY